MSNEKPLHFERCHNNWNKFPLFKFGMPSIFGYTILLHFDSGVRFFLYIISPFAQLFSHFICLLSESQNTKPQKYCTFFCINWPQKYFEKENNMKTAKIRGICFSICVYNIQLTIFGKQITENYIFVFLLSLSLWHSRKILSFDQFFVQHLFFLVVCC